MGIKYLVHGAICACKFGSTTDELVVKTQNILYLNDLNSEKRLAATTTDVGATFKKNCFGSCAKKPKGAACTAEITQWRGAENSKKIVSGANLLTEHSKAGCPLAGADCIYIVHSGQQAELSRHNLENYPKELAIQINPCTKFYTAPYKNSLTKPSKIYKTLKVRKHV